MQSSSGLYISKLDHVRACAAFVVYCWHVVHTHVPFETIPAFAPLSMLEEGHIGVALFMTLSGYLFAKIIDGRPIDLPRFYRNRVLRLAPLLTVVLAYWTLRGDMSLDSLLKGFVLPTWHSGGWSVAVELHFYVLFPAILWLQRGHRIGALLALFIVSILTRFAIWSITGHVQAFSYWTIGGCIDLFLAGMLWHELSKRDIVRRHAGWLFAGSLIALVAAWHAFNLAGGFYGTTNSPLWIILPTLQGLAFGAVIVGYENARFQLPRAADRALAKVGEVSYSIYLLHFIFYPTIVKQLANAGIDMASFSIALAVAALTFPLIVAIAMLSYRFIEQPFLKLRGTYDRKSMPAPRSDAITSAA